jgi:hypothetical protein
MGDALRILYGRPRTLGMLIRCSLGARQDEICIWVLGGATKNGIGFASTSRVPPVVDFYTAESCTGVANLSVTM